MNILLLTQIVPYPPDSGPKVKTYHVLRYLAQHGYRITLVSFVREQEDLYLKDLKPCCTEIHSVPIRRSRSADMQAYAQSLHSGLPFLVTRDAKPEMYRIVRQLVEQQHFDVIHADQLTMAQFTSQVSGYKLQATNAPALVFDAHNAVYKIIEGMARTAPLPLRPVLALEARRIKRYEGALIRQFDHTLAVSEVDRKALLEAADSEGGRRKAEIKDPETKISVVPIAVDSTSLQPVTRTGGSLNILTMGTLYYPPNAEGVRWFINQVFSLVRHQMPEATMTIVGPRPPKDIMQYAIRHTPYATVTGYVPDLQPYLERAAMVVVPVRAASGMRVRILEALARGVPVVTTTTGVEGIDAVNEKHLLVADEPEEFAAAVLRILENPDLGRYLAENGRRLVEKKYDWRVVLPCIEAVYRSLRERIDV